MHDTLDSFDRKCQEIECYFAFLENIGMDNVELRIKKADGNFDHIAVKPELKTMLKATVFLLLYSLVESSIRNGILSIYDALSTDSITFRQAHEKVKKIWIKYKTDNLREANMGAIRKACFDLVDDAIRDSTLQLNEDDIDFSGNLDARKIIDISDDFGFSCEVPTEFRGGQDLLPVKNQRNSLSHGNKSFIECGREYTYSDLVEIKDGVKGFVEHILYNIKDYIDNKKYKRTGIEQND